MLQWKVKTSYFYYFIHEKVKSEKGDSLPISVQNWSEIKVFLSKKLFF